MKADLKYVMSPEDEFDEACLILDIQQEFFKTQFESVKSEMFEQYFALENENCCLKKTIAQLQNDFSKLEAQSIAFKIALQHNIQENNSLKTMQTENENFMASLQIENAYLKQTYTDLFETIQSTRVETNPCDDVKLKFDFDEIEIQNIELEYKVASLIKENRHLKLVYNFFYSIKKLRVEKQSSNVSQNKAENLKSQLSEFMGKKFNQVFQKFESRNSNDFLQQPLYDFDPSTVESESGENKTIFGNETSSFETKIKKLE
nr:reverse transcriptase zinc-binding domain-containing protein [Tanacetum cinerariifolium]